MSEKQFTFDRQEGNYERKKTLFGTDGGVLGGGDPTVFDFIPTYQPETFIVSSSFDVPKSPLQCGKQDEPCSYLSLATGHPVIEFESRLAVVDAVDVEEDILLKNTMCPAKGCSGTVNIIKLMVLGGGRRDTRSCEYGRGGDNCL
jgi:hypothetical protein